MKKLASKISAMLLLICLIVSPVNVQAAKSSEGKVYKEILEKGYTVTENGNKDNRTYKYFNLLDIDRNGVKELVVKEFEGGAWYSTDVFTIKKGKVVFCGTVIGRGQTSMTYVKKYHSLYTYGWTNGIGAAYSFLWRLNGTKIDRWKFCWAGSESMGSSKMVYKTGKNSESCKKVSKSTYNAFFKKYFKNRVDYKYVENTAANREKLL